MGSGAAVTAGVAVGATVAVGDDADVFVAVGRAAVAVGTGGGAGVGTADGAGTSVGVGSGIGLGIGVCVCVGVGVDAAVVEGTKSLVADGRAVGAVLTTNCVPRVVEVDRGSGSSVSQADTAAVTSTSSEMLRTVALELCINTMRICTMLSMYLEGVPILPTRYLMNDNACFRISDPPAGADSK